MLAALRQTKVEGSGERLLVRVALFSTDSAKDRTVANIRRLAVFLQPLGHVTTDRQIRQMVRRSRCAHNSIAACLARSRSGLRATCGVVATWRLSQSRKSSSMIANCEPLIGSTWSSLMIWSSPDLSASRTTTAAFSLLVLRRWRTSAMASPNDSNGYPSLSAC